MEHVHIFDTTLRDGEQSPGFSMNTEEKLQLARQLEQLGVDVIEAGFPIASPGDLEAVRAVAAEIKDCRVAALARARQEDMDAALRGDGARRKAARAHFSGDFRPAPEAQAADFARRGAGRRLPRWCRMAAALRRCGIFRGRCQPH